MARKKEENASPKAKPDLSKAWPEQSRRVEGPARSFDQIVEQINREGESGSPVRDTVSLTQTTHIIAERERRFRKKYTSAVKRLIKGLPDQVINNIREQFPVGSISYSAYVDRNCTLLMEGELVIGHGDYNALGKILLDLEGLREPAATSQLVRQQAIWLLLYHRLRLIPPAPVLLKCAEKLGLDPGHIQTLSRAFLEELIPRLEQEYGPEAFGRGTEQRKKFDEVLRRYACLEDSQEYRDYVSKNTIILAVADYNPYPGSGRLRPSVKSRKKIYQITADARDSKSFFPREFLAVAGRKKDKSFKQTVPSLFIARTKRGERYAVSQVLNQFAEEKPDKFLVALVRNEKEAHGYADYVNNNAYRDKERKVRVVPIEQAEHRPLPALISVIRGQD
jgi:hypothetical protein